MYLTRTVASSIDSGEKGSVMVSPRKISPRKSPLTSKNTKLRTEKNSGLERTTDLAKVSLIIGGDGIIQVENDDSLMKIKEYTVEEIYPLPSAAEKGEEKF